MAGLLKKRRGEVSSVFLEEEKETELDRRVKKIKEYLPEVENVKEEPQPQPEETTGFVPKVREKARKKVERLTATASKEEKEVPFQPDMDHKAFEKDEGRKKRKTRNAAEEGEFDDEELDGKQPSPVKRRIVGIILSLCCVYMVFLIYGVVMTDFVFDSDGVVTPEIKTLQEVTAQHEFENVVAYYYRARMIYENCLTLDYRIAKGEEDPLAVSPDYEKMLDSIGKLSIDLQALTVDKSYTQIQEMLLAWVGTDIAVYCQNMASAISKNDSSAAEQAILGREVCYNDFAILTANIVSMGSTLKGVDISDIRDWSTEKYTREVLEGEMYNA